MTGNKNPHITMPIQKTFLRLPEKSSCTDYVPYSLSLYRVIRNVARITASIIIITCSIEVSVFAICSGNPVEIVIRLYAVDDIITAIAPVESDDTVNKAGRSQVFQNGTYLTDMMRIPVYTAVLSAKIKLMISSKVTSQGQKSMFIFKCGRIDIRKLIPPIIIQTDRI